MTDQQDIAGKYLRLISPVFDLSAREWEVLLQACRLGGINRDNRAEIADNLGFRTAGALGNILASLTSQKLLIRTKPGDYSVNTSFIPENFSNLQRLTFVFNRAESDTT